MNMFYNCPSWYSIIISLLSVICILLWSASVIYEIYSRHSKTLMTYFNEIYQILILGIWFVYLEMIAYVRMGFEINRLLVPRFYSTRLILCMLTGCCYFIKEVYIWKNQKDSESINISCKSMLYMIVNMLPVLVLLPEIERIAGKNYSYIFAGMIIIGIMYSLCRIFYYRKDLKEELSWYSIKEALDRLPTGVLFAKKDGTILLMNLQMQKLADIILGTQLWDAKKLFYEVMEETNIQNNCKRIKLDNSYVYMLPDDSIWLFSKAELILKKRTDIQLTATNITKQWQMTQELRVQQQELEEQRQKLKQTTTEFQKVIQEEEIVNIRSRFHDILGQRIAILLRGLREGKSPDDQLLTTFMKEFYDEFEDTAHREQNVEKLNSLCKVMEKIGVDLRFELADGDVNEDSYKCIDLNTVINITESEKKELGLCLDVLREACTNAVRHGFASRIGVKFKYVLDELQILIQNDGIKPKGEICEGSGLKSIRRKIEAVGGSLSILTDPQFTLCIRFKRRK